IESPIDDGAASPPGLFVKDSPFAGKNNQARGQETGVPVQDTPHQTAHWEKSGIFESLLSLTGSHPSHIYHTPIPTVHYPDQFFFHSVDLPDVVAGIPTN